jgi:chemotaxis protein MotB
MAKKQHHEEHENHERWLVSWADFMTLLFALFVVLYAVGQTDNKKASQVTQSIRFAMHFAGTGGLAEIPIFEGPPSSGGCITNMGSEGGLSSAEKEVLEQTRKRLNKRIKNFIRPDRKNPIAIHVEGRRIGVRLSASHFFDASQAAIRPEVLPVLDAIASELAALKRLIRVEGHTDNLPVGTSRFRDNWDLSSSRAAAVASYIQRAHQVDGKLLAAAGHGATRPLVSNDTPDGREANRRIEMVVELKPGDALESLGR